MAQAAKSDAFEPSPALRPLADRLLALRLSIEYSKWTVLPSQLQAAIRRHGAFKINKLRRSAAGFNASSSLKELIPIADWLLQFGVQPFLAVARYARAKKMTDIDLGYILPDGYSAVRTKITGPDSLEAYGRAWVDALSGNSNFQWCYLRTVASSLPLIMPWITSAQDFCAVLRSIFDTRRDVGITFFILLPLFADQLRNEQDLKEYLEVAWSNRLTYFTLEHLAKALGPVNTPQELGDVIRMGQQLYDSTAYGNGRSLLIESLPANAPIVRRYGLRPIVDIVGLVGQDAHATISSGLSAVSDLILEYGIGPFVEMASYSKDRTSFLFTSGLPSLEPIVRRLGIAAFVDLSKDVGPHTGAVCLALAQSAALIASESDLHNLNTWRQGLYAVRTNLQRPWLEQTKEDQYGLSYTISHDPDKDKREVIDDAIAEVRRRVVKADDDSPHSLHSSLMTLTNLPPVIEDFLDLLARNDLEDVVIIGGVPRDTILGLEFSDVDVTFSMDLLPEDKALESDPYLWNSVLDGALRNRISKLMKLIDTRARWDNTSPIHQLYVRHPRFPQVDYVGPYEIYSDTMLYRGRWSPVYSRTDGRFISLDPGLPINSLGITTDRQLVGDPSGLQDLESRCIRTVKPIDSLAPDTVLRLIVLSQKLNCAMAEEVEDAILRFRDHAKDNPKQFIARAGKTTGLTRLLRDITDPRQSCMFDEMVRLGIAEIYAPLSPELQRRLDASRPQPATPRRRPIGLWVSLSFLAIAAVMALYLWLRT